MHGFHHLLHSCLTLFHCFLASVYGLSDWFAGAFSQPYTGPIDDVVIGYEIGTIDGLGGILGQAGPRFATGGRTLSGVMLFEAVDFDRYDENEVRAIILHEMGKLWFEPKIETSFLWFLELIH